MSRFDLSDVETETVFLMKSDTDVVRDILDRNRARIGDVSASLAGFEGAPELDPIGRVLILAAVADLRCAETRLEEVLERLRGDARAESADPYPVGSAGVHGPVCDGCGCPRAKHLGDLEAHTQGCPDTPL